MLITLDFQSTAVTGVSMAAVTEWTDFTSLATPCNSVDLSLEPLFNVTMLWDLDQPCRSTPCLTARPLLRGLVPRYMAQVPSLAVTAMLSAL